MGIAMTVNDYLDYSGVPYDLIEHKHTGSSKETAQASKIPSEKLAKAVILEDTEGSYMMAVIPASHRVDLGAVGREMYTRVGLATEAELEFLFSDCETGAIPPMGQAYEMDVLCDERLDELDDIYFEAGDHRDLVHMKGQGFQKLMMMARHGNYSHRM